MVTPHTQQSLIESLAFIAEYSIAIDDERLREQQKVPANQDELAKSIYNLFSQIARRGGVVLMGKDE